MWARPSKTRLDESKWNSAVNLSQIRHMNELTHLTLHLILTDLVQQLTCPQLLLSVAGEENMHLSLKRGTVLTDFCI